MIVDYFVVRRQRYQLIDLYKDGGVYPRWNAAGLIAFFVPVSLTVVALTTPGFGWFYNYGWFTGSILGAVIYVLLSTNTAGGRTDAVS